MAYGIQRFARQFSPRRLLVLAALTSLALRRRPGANRVLLATLLSVLVTDGLKPVVHRRRPRWFGTDRRQSFPSGHSAASTAYLLATALATPARLRPFALGVATVGVAGVDVARVATRAHWPSDVLAGDVLGILSVAAASAGLGG